MTTPIQPLTHLPEWRILTDTVLPCDCVSDTDEAMSQLKRFGDGLRLHTVFRTNSGNRRVRCSICGKERALNGT